MIFMAVLVEKATKTLSKFIGPVKASEAFLRPRYSIKKGVPVEKIIKAIFIVIPIKPQTIKRGNKPKPVLK